MKIMQRDVENDFAVKLYLGLFFIPGFFTSALPFILESNLLMRVGIFALLFVITLGQILAGIGVRVFLIQIQSRWLSIGLTMIMVSLPLLIFSIIGSCLMFDTLVYFAVGLFFLVFLLLVLILAFLYY